MESEFNNLKFGTCKGDSGGKENLISNFTISFDIER